MHIKLDYFCFSAFDFEEKVIEILKYRVPEYAWDPRDY